jgi:hypothetical protein
LNREDRVSGYYNESDSEEFYENPDNSGGGLRDYIKKLEETNKRLEKLLEKDAEKTVADLLADKHLDPAVASVIPKDADPKAWLEENGRLFATSVPAAEQEEVVPETVVVSNDDDPAVQAEREAREQMLAAQQAGTPVVTQADVDRVADMSAEDILAEITKAQAVNG